eukprot:Hpha_TRINITY_DN3538_c0_g1::TRINITY_DN3538_c0_g1_i1::g.25618::m.25618
MPPSAEQLRFLSDERYRHRMTTSPPPPPPDLGDCRPRHGADITQSPDPPSTARSRMSRATEATSVTAARSVGARTAPNGRVGRQQLQKPQWSGDYRRGDVTRAKADGDSRRERQYTRDTYGRTLSGSRRSPRVSSVSAVLPTRNLARLSPSKSGDLWDMLWKEEVSLRASQPDTSAQEAAKQSRDLYERYEQFNQELVKGRRRKTLQSPSRRNVSSSPATRSRVASYAGGRRPSPSPAGRQSSRNPSPAPAPRSRNPSPSPVCRSSSTSHASPEVRVKEIERIVRGLYAGSKSSVLTRGEVSAYLRKHEERLGKLLGRPRCLFFLVGTQSKVSLPDIMTRVRTQLGTAQGSNQGLSKPSPSGGSRPEPPRQVPIYSRDHVFPAVPPAPAAPPPAAVPGGVRRHDDPAVEVYAAVRDMLSRPGEHAEKLKTLLREAEADVQTYSRIKERGPPVLHVQEQRQTPITTPPPKPVSPPQRAVAPPQPSRSPPQRAAPPPQRPSPP